jgi:hypothetical protein
MYNLEPLLSLDIKGSSDIDGDNVLLLHNKHKLVARGSASTIRTIRDEVLERRGLKVPEKWEISWTLHHGTAWTPASLAYLETWACPEFFQESSTNTGKCDEIINKVDGTSTAFEQDVSSKMPSIQKDINFRNFEGLSFDGDTDMMKGVSSSAWNAGTQDFMLGVVTNNDPDSGARAPSVSKRDGDYFILEQDNSSGRENIVFKLGGIEYTITPDSDRRVTVCGRKDGYPFIYCNDDSVVATSTDLTSISVNYKPWIGDKRLSSDEYMGEIYEIVFVNESLGSSGKEVTTENIEKLLGYLAHKYGLQSLLGNEHTYRSSPPSDGAV